MTKRTRTIIFWSAVVVFVIGSYGFIGYASGYRFDWENFRFHETGTVYLETTPAKSEIFVNGNYVDSTSFLASSYAYKFLLPGKYTFEVRKQNRLSWRKTVEVAAQNVNHFIHIYLPPEHVDFFISEKPENNLNNPKQTNKPVISFALASEENRRLVKSVSGGVEQQISSFEFPEFYFSTEVVQLSDAVFLVLVKKENKIEGDVFLLQDNRGKLIASNIIAMEKDKNGEKVLLRGGYDISVLWLQDNLLPYVVKNGEINMLTRLSYPIKNAQWFYDGAHVLYLVNGNIYLAEIDPRGERNIYQLVTEVDDFSYDSNSSRLTVQRGGRRLEAELK